MKNFKKIAALVLAAMMLLSISVMALADGEATLTNGVSGSSSGTANEVLKIDKSIKAYNPNTESVGSPTITYTYTIASGSAAKTVTDSNSVSASVRAGITPGNVVITAQNNNGAGHLNELVWSPSATTLADLNASSAGVDNTKYITFDFSAIEFGNPGVYRYVITETASAAVASGQYGTTGVDAGNNSQTETLYLDVYVRQSASYDASSATPANNWDVYGYALFKNDNSIDATYDTDSNEPAVSAAQKVSAFTTDTYYTYDLTITKTLVNDAMQNLNQFPFGIDFSGSVTGVLPKISGTASITTVPSTWTTAGAIDSAFDVATTDGTLKIANGGTVTIVGIPVGTTVSITEKNNVAGTTYSVTTSGADSFTTGTVYYNADSNAAAVTSTTTISGENYKTHAVTFTNTFAEISPTGIAFRVAPYALILAAGIVLFLIARRRKNSDAE